jgi:hypothetical protein
MLVGLCPSIEQLRYYVRSALCGFEDLDVDTAIENARSELSALLAYLDVLATTNDAIPVFGLSVINGSARIVPIGSQAQINDPADFKILGFKGNAQFLSGNADLGLFRPEND